jgi:signal transduction histidine kinase
MNLRFVRDRLTLVLLGCAFAAAAAGWGLFYWHTQAVREVTLTRAGATALSQSRILREHAEQAFTAALIALRSLDGQPGVEGIQAGADSRNHHLRLRQLRDSSPLFEGIGVVDERGRLSASADSDPPPVPGLDLSDRDYFIHHRDTPGSDPLFGAPVASRPSGVRAIPVSRRLDDEQGRFRGVVAARLRPSYFEDLYGSVGADGVALILGDSTIMASVPPANDVEIRKLVSASPAARRGVPDDGLSEYHPEPDSEGQLIGYSRSRIFPLGVVVAFDMAKLLAQWRADRNTLTALAAMCTLALFLLSAVLLRRTHRQWRLTVALESAMVAAEAANRSKSEFLAHMSHELRTPLNAINGFSEVMATQMFGPLGNARYIDYARIIRNSGQHLLSVINNILDLAKVDAGRWEIDPEPVSLADVARDVCDLTKGRAEASSVTLRTELPPGLPVVTTDRRLLLQVLTNLTTNGIKFTPPQGTVTISAAVAANMLEITVTDTGCGMSASDIERVLEPFGRANSALARKHHDTGLGLPLSKRFVEMIGGRLEINSVVNQGTRATVHLPLNAAGTAESPVAAMHAA